MMATLLHYYSDCGSVTPMTTVTPKTLFILILNMMDEVQYLTAGESHLALVGI